MFITCPLSILDNVNPKERKREMQRARRAATEKQRNELNKKHHEARQKRIITPGHREIFEYECLSHASYHCF